MFLFKILLACLILKSEWLAKGMPIYKSVMARHPYVHVLEKRNVSKV